MTAFIGNLDSPSVSAVDPFGTIVAPGAAWSLGWWVEAEGKLVPPHAVASTRQDLVGRAPVVETRMRVAGDVAHRAFGARLPADGVVVEVENRSPAPLIVGLVLSAAGRIDVADDRVLVDGRLALRLARPPGAVALGCDPFDLDTLRGASSTYTGPRFVQCRDGRAHAALLAPVSHRARLRCTMLAAEPDGPVAAVASSEDIVRAWDAHARRGLQLDVPDGPLNDAVHVLRRRLLLLAPAAATQLGAVGLCELAGALDRFGLHEEAGRTIAALVEHHDGAVDLAAAIVAMADHVLLSARTDAGAGRDAYAVQARQWLAGAVQALDRGRRGGARRRAGAGRGGLDAAGEAWARRAFAAAAVTAQAAGDDRLARTCRDRAGAAHHRAVDARPPAESAQDLDSDLQDASPVLTWDSDGTSVAAAAQRTARLLASMRDRVLHERPDGEPGPPGIELCAGLPSEWRHMGIAAHDAPTRHGIVSFALRWHGDRAALLWSITGDGPIDVSAPGLDAAWRGAGRRGEALLAPAPQ